MKTSITPNFKYQYYCSDGSPSLNKGWIISSTTIAGAIAWVKMIRGERLTVELQAPDFAVLSVETIPDHYVLCLITIPE